MPEPVRIPLPGEADTLRLGEALGRAVFPGAVVGLTGPLGAGKTTFVRGLAAGMGIDEGYVVASPTYTLLQVYPCRGLELWHLDLYRIHSPDDLDSTGYRDGVGGARVLAVEWADREPACLPAEHLLIELDYDGEARKATIQAKGEVCRRMAERAVEEFMGKGPRGREGRGARGRKKRHVEGETR